MLPAICERLLTTLGLLLYFWSNPSTFTPRQLLTVVRTVENIVLHSSIDSTTWLALAPAIRAILGLSQLNYYNPHNHHHTWKETKRSFDRLKVYLVTSWSVGLLLPTMSVADLWDILAIRNIGELMYCVLYDIRQRSSFRLHTTTWGLSDEDRDTYNTISNVVLHIKVLSGGFLKYGERFESNVVVEEEDARAHYLWSSIIQCQNLITNECRMHGTHLL